MSRIGVRKVYFVDVVRTLSTEVNTTTLPNGLRIASLPSHSPISSVGVFVDCGSRYENPDISGITHFLELMTLKSTRNRTDFRLVREMQKMGANLTASAGREHMVYAAESLREFMPAMVGTLSDIIQNHQFHIEEVMEEKEIYEHEAPLRLQSQEYLVTEGIHEAAYGRSTLGLPVLGPLHNLGVFNGDILKQWQQLHHTPKRMVVTGYGVEHQELVDVVKACFTSLGSENPDLVKEKAKYIGGEIRHHARVAKGDLSRTQIALAWESAGWHDKDLVAMCVLQTMMGGGGSFSAGGPGKGMYTRLYTNLLNKHHWIDSANCFNSIHSDSTLFGFTGISPSNHVGELVDVFAKEALRMTGTVEKSELSRAKVQLKSVVLMQLESRHGKLDDIGRQMMVYGRVQSAKEIIGQIEAVSDADIVRVARKMLTTPLSFSAQGDCTNIPRYDLIQNLFK